MGMGNVVMTYDLVCCERVPTRVCMSMRHMCVCVCVPFDEREPECREASGVDATYPLIVCMLSCLMVWGCFVLNAPGGARRHVRARVALGGRVGERAVTTHVGCVGPEGGGGVAIVY